MKADVAIAICNEWFNYLDRQRDRARKVQELAAMARAGDGLEARKRLRQMDHESVTVYDGGRLEPAVRALIKLAQSPRNSAAP